MATLTAADLARLARVELNESPKMGPPALECSECGGYVCTAETGDTMETLTLLALDHECEDEQ